MDRLCILWGAFTFQFWAREWAHQELFVKTLLAYFFNSPTFGFEADADFQTF